MPAALAMHTFVVGERFDRAMKLLRGALADMEIEIVGEFNAADVLSLEPAPPGSRSKILLVDCPLLDFEALALDRASAVFFPLHLLVSEMGDRTAISLANPSEIFDARLPVGSADPMERLLARVELAVDSIQRRQGGPVD